MTAAPEPLALDARLSIAVGAGERTFTVEAELALEAGVLVLFGPSGVGKTLTLQALAGFLPRVRGHLRVAGEVLLDSARGACVPAHARRVGYVPQEQALFPFLDVAGNVTFGLPRAERGGRGPRVSALLDELGLLPLASALPGSLSGGERQRVALGRALAVEPRLLLLDEPFAAIDDEGRAALQKLLLAVIARRRTPVVLVTHHPGEARAIGDRLVRFERGRTAACGDPRAVLGAPVVMGGPESPPKPPGVPGDGSIVIAGRRRGPVETLGEGRGRARLDGALIEGPEALLRGEDGQPLRIELPRGPGDPQ
jgi:molybdate transport system ATP-binding protein